MLERLITLVATGFGAGKIRIAPGTAGSVLGLGYWWLLTRIPNDYFYGVAVVAGIAFAVWCAGAAERILGAPDPSIVVIDEIVAVPLAMIGQVALHWNWWAIAMALVLYRVFDVWKPLYIGEVQKVGGGLGIVLDDVAAAICASVVTWLIVAVILVVYDLTQ